MLAQGFLLPDREAPLREFFWVSLFFVLTTPLLQSPRYTWNTNNFHTIGDLAGTQMPYMLELLVNLVIAGTAGLMFQLLWRWQYSGDSRESSALRRASSVALPPVISAYAVVDIFTNISVSIQLAVLLRRWVPSSRTASPARSRIQYQRARPAVPALDYVGTGDSFDCLGDSGHSSRYTCHPICRAFW